jgi:PIN domain nuclease of toxin-antitoxin system
MASIWEMQIKHQLGKLSLHPSLGQIIEEQKRVNGISILNIKLSHILAIGELPLHHRDPFDRLLIAQAKFEKIGFISRDPEIAKYVDLIW